MNDAYNIDCMEYMRTVPDKYFDLAVVDPPYGLKYDTMHRTGSKIQMVGGGARPAGGKKNNPNGTGISSRVYHPFDDSSIPGPEYFTELERIAKHRIIWGGNFFLDYLGRASCLIVWDKKRRGLDQADCEIAWTDLPGQSRIFEYLWNGMLIGANSRNETRFHPTQKPVDLYRWIFEQYASEGDKVIDTHLGSGSSRIAAYDAHLDFVGCEIDAHYFQLQEQRFADYTAQTSLFI